MPHPTPSHTPPAPVTAGARQVTVGVDTHKHLHVAAARDQLGRPVATLTAPATSAGYAQLAAWAGGLGEVVGWGIEGTGSYGAGLTRYLHRHGHRVTEVNRPNRQTRRRNGKSDPADADAAARAVQAGDASVTPKAQDGLTEMLRSLRATRQSAIKARTQAINTLKALLVTAPAELREQLAGLTVPRLVTAIAAHQPGRLATPHAAVVVALQSLATRIQHLTGEAKQLATHLDHLTAAYTPALRAQFGIGPDSAAALLITAGDNPHRLTSDAALAALCGASPVDASSGLQQRHRLNRGGNRQANAALHRIALARLRYHPPTQAYAARRTAQGKTRREILRCLKRLIARELFPLLRQLPTLPTDPSTT